MTAAAPKEAAGAAGGPGHRSQWQLIRRRFARHRVALAALAVLAVLAALALGAEFFAPYPKNWQHLPHAYCPPQPPRFSFAHGLFVYGAVRHTDPITFQKTYVEDRRAIVPLGFFVRGEPYRLWGLIPWDRHLFGVDRAAFEAPQQPRVEANAADAAGSAETKTAADGGEDGRPTPTFYLLGADKYGRDIFSRIVYGARISLSVGLVGIGMTFLLGIVIGGASGYVGGAVDNFIQRLIEVVNSFPQLPLWLGLAAAMPKDWSPLRVYFGITIVLSLLNWTGLARVVRGKLLALREEDYAMAARLLGAGHGRIIFRHLLPGFTSHVIVALTLSVPAMILGETALSFLGLGLRPPVVSWGVLVQDCMNMEVVEHYPWLLLPALFIVITVLCFNFVGDGLRDAADPYATVR